MIQNTLFTLAGIAQLATGFAATKYVAEYRVTEKDKAGRILGLFSSITGVMGVVATLLLVACAPWLARFALNAPNLSSALLIASGSVLFTVLNGYQMGALAGLESFRTIARIGTIHGILHFAICCTTAWVWGLNGALAGFVLSALVRWGIYFYALRKESASQDITISYAGIWKEHNIIFKFAVPAALSGLSSMVALWLGNAFLVRQNAGYSQMGLFSAASSLRMMILFLPLLINNVGMTLLNTMKGQDDQIRYKKIFWFNLLVIAGIVSFGVLIIALFGSWLLRMYGKDFIEGYRVLLILAISTIPESISVAAAQIVQSREKMWLSLFVIALPKDLGILILAYILTPLSGAVGLAWAYTLAWSLTLVIVLSIIYRLGIKFETNY